MMSSRIRSGLCSSTLQGLDAVAGGDDLDRERFEERLEQLDVLRVVVDDQDGGLGRNDSLFGSDAGAAAATAGLVWVMGSLIRQRTRFARARVRLDYTPLATGCKRAASVSDRV